jgi:hypothetical protein
VDDRGDPRVEQAGQGLDDLLADAGAAGGEGAQPQEHQPAHHLLLDRVTRAGGMRPDERPL